MLKKFEYKKLSSKSKQESHDYQQVEALAGLFKTQNFFLSPVIQEKATYLIAADDKRGAYGGAILYPEKISSCLDPSLNDTQEDFLKKMFSAFQPRGNEYWIARVCLCMGQDSSTPFHETINLSQNFYENLYEALTEFGEQKGIDYLPFSLRDTDARINHAFTYQNWPYLLEIKSAGSAEGYFHGILSLKGKKFEIRRLKRISSNINVPNKLKSSFPRIAGRNG